MTHKLFPSNDSQDNAAYLANSNESLKTVFEERFTGKV